MPLTYDFTKIQNWEQVCQRKLKEGDEGFDPKKDLYRNTRLAEAMIWMTIFIGMREILKRIGSRSFGEQGYSKLQREHIGIQTKATITLRKTKSKV